MHDEGWLTDLHDLTLYLPDEPAQFQHQAARQRSNAGL
jgi:hypothetical protein